MITKDAPSFACLHLAMNEMYQQYIIQISSTSFQSMPLFCMKGIPAFHSHMGVHLSETSGLILCDIIISKQFRHIDFNFFIISVFLQAVCEAVS